jgi:uncharacterized protein YndB with AHSA1/START domain
MNDDLGEISICYSVTFTRTSKHSAARLWRAITEPEEVERWMGFPAHIDLRPGGAYVLDFDSLTPGDKLDGTVIKVDPERLLRYAVGTTVVNWAIEPDGDGCRHTFSQAGLPPREGEEGLVAGWHDGLDSLDEYLDGEPRTSWEQSRERWSELKGRYRPAFAQLAGGAVK